LKAKKKEAGHEQKNQTGADRSGRPMALASFSRFLDWMNLPSDLWLWSGIVGTLVLLVVVPSLIAAIWRPQRH
jgi:hypothetical protein